MKWGRHLCRVPANFVVWVRDHNHLASEIWKAIKLPPGLSELLGARELEISRTMARGRLRRGTWGRH